MRETSIIGSCDSLWLKLLAALDRRDCEIKPVESSRGTGTEMMAQVLACAASNAAINNSQGYRMIPILQVGLLHSSAEAISLTRTEDMSGCAAVTEGRLGTSTNVTFQVSATARSSNQESFLFFSRRICVKGGQHV